MYRTRTWSVAVLVAATGLLPVPSAQAEQPVTISGTVWRDVNANGMREPSEPGIGNVGMGVVKPDGSLADSGYSGPDGHYSFSGMPSDNYHVTMLVPDGQTLVRPNTGDEATDSDLSWIDATSQQLRCTGGDCGVIDAGLVDRQMDIVLSAKPGEIDMPPGSRIDLKVALHNTGNVPSSNPTLTMPVTEAGPVENAPGPGWECFVKRDTYLCGFSGELEPGQTSDELTIPLTVPEQPDTVELVASAEGDVNPADNKAKIEVNPGERK